ncbi:MAG: hypothetical protein HY795_05215 [Desulfovibrio sp.]|nr:hypothetical protein [Desulfovibrio sp.]MBI4959233.1 hypothetical protein [Desulfovibrio sp.]
MKENKTPPAKTSKSRSTKNKTKTQKTGVPPKETMPVQELTTEEKAKVDAWSSREKAKTKPPRFKVTQGKSFEIGHAGPDNKLAFWAEAIQNSTGFSSVAQGANFIAQVTQAITPFFGQDAETVQKALNDSAANLLELKPGDATEALLVGQMLASNNAAMDCMRRAMLKDQTSYGREFNLKFADRFMRTYTAQMEALTKYRKGGQQKVIVEHVHVYQGGQAIVGNVNQPGGGRDGQKKGDTTPCLRAIDQGKAGIPLRLEDGQEVWCEMQEDGGTLPATSDG